MILPVLLFPSATTNVDFLTLLVSVRVPACFPLSLLFTTHSFYLSFFLCLNAKLLYPLFLQQLFRLCKPQGVLWLELYFPVPTSASSVSTTYFPRVFLMLTTAVHLSGAPALPSLTQQLLLFFLEFLFPCPVVFAFHCLSCRAS